MILRASRTSCGTAACDIVAGCDKIVSTPPKLTETSGNVNASTNACALDSSFNLNPSTAPPWLACAKCNESLPG